MNTTSPIYDWMSPDEVNFRKAAEASFLAATKQAGYTEIISYEQCS